MMNGAWLMVTNSQALERKPSSLLLRAQASSPSLQAQGSGSQGTSVQAGPGHKLPGQKYFFYA